MGLKSHRKTQNLSQEQLAELAGLNVRTIQRIETGGKPSLASLQCLAKALKIDATDIVNDTAVQALLNADNQGKSNANLPMIFLSLAAILIMFGAKSEGVSVHASAFFYVTAAIMFISVAITIYNVDKK